LWISTRPHAVKILEKALNKKVVCLLPFLPENQIEFVTSYWNLKMTKRGNPEAVKLIEKVRFAIME